jgi:1-deoxy-D-xylulose-5-phosphate reductoisomerase
MVQFEDGSIKAQLGLPDMKLPIQYAMGFPKRIKNDFTRFNFLDYPTLEFEPPNTKIFRNLALSFEAMEKGGNMPCILNAANEVVVEAFLKKKIKFLQMPEIIEKVMGKVGFIKEPGLEDLIETNSEARKITTLLTENRS